MRPVIPDLVAALDDDATLADLADDLTDDLTEIGYPLAERPAGS